MALHCGPKTFTLDRLRRLWKDDEPLLGNFPYEECQHLAYDSEHKLKYPEAAMRLCLDLFSSVQDPSNHLSQLDASLGPLFMRPFPKFELKETTVSSYP